MQWKTANENYQLGECFVYQASLSRNRKLHLRTTYFPDEGRRYCIALTENGSTRSEISYSSADGSIKVQGNVKEILEYAQPVKNSRKMQDLHRSMFSMILASVREGVDVETL